MDRRQRLGGVLAQPVDRGDELRAGLDRDVVERGPVAVDEPAPHHRHQRRHAALGGRPVEPRELLQRRIAPSWAVEPHRLVDGQRRLLDAAPDDLVALLGGRQVLHHDHDVGGAALERGEVAVGPADIDRVREVAVERDLGLVGEGLHAGRRALRVTRRELAHDRRRPRVAVVGQRVAHVVADLARPDRPRVEGGHARSVADRAAVPEHLRQPLGRDELGVSDERRSVQQVHTPMRSPAPAKNDSRACASTSLSWRSQIATASVVPSTCG